MIDTWGYPGVLDYLRRVFRGQELPLDATAEDILFYVGEYLARDKKGIIQWHPTRVQFVGPKCPAEDRMTRKDRITISFGVIKDGRRVIEDITIG